MPVVAAMQAREIIQLVPCAAKTVAVASARGIMLLMLSAGIHANYRCNHTACFTIEKRALAWTCSLRTV